MLDLLSDILHGVLDLPYLLVGLLVESINGWILILAALLAAVLSVLPGFPSLPTVGSEIVGGVSWFLPIAGMLGIFATFLAAWLIWMGVSVAMRWVKAL